MPSDTNVSIQEVIDYVDSRLGNFNDGVAWVTSRGDELERLKRYFKDKVEYTVTFKEENEEEDVEIKVYKTADKEDTEETLPTDASGEASEDFTNGTYYFTATKDGKEDYEGSFTVQDDDVTVEFEMVSED